MNLEAITPVLLTLDEEANIGRTLSRLSWAREIVVVDSQSRDRTAEIVASFPQARLVSRAFDAAAAQWNYAVQETGIRSEWVLALDADYLVEPALVAELEALDPVADVAGFAARFVYCVWGRKLRGSVYPPVTVLFRRARSRYRQDGHTQRVILDGRVARLATPILHDDRKPLASWLRNQGRYMELEADVLDGRRFSELSLPDRLRRLHLGAPAMLVYCLIAKRGLLDGAAGVHYALQRTLAEALITLSRLDKRLRARNGHD